MSRQLLLNLILLGSLLSPVWAADPLVGKRVVVIKDKAPLAASGKEVGKASECTVFTVDKVDGEWLWIKSERAYLRRGDVVPFEDAIAHYTRQLETNKTANNYWNRAQIWRLKGELDIALGDMDDAIHLNSNESAWFLGRGILWYDKKEHDKAIADYSEAIRLDPKSGAAYRNRGVVWSDKKDYDKAIADHNEALKHIDPHEKVGVFYESDITGGDSTAMVKSRALTFSNRGWDWQNKGDHERALADYDEAIRLDPKFKKPRTNRRHMWAAQAAWDKVIADCDEAIRENPKDINSFNERGYSHMERKEFDKALADYIEVIRLDPKHSQAHNNRGWLWEKKGVYDKALADFEEAIMLDPKDPDPCTNFAWVRATCPDEKYCNGQQAVEYATKACELTAWKEAGNLDTLAAAYAEAGDFDKAVEWQKKGMDIAPADKKADYETRLKLYQEKKPYRQPAPQ